jgi:hypothetical protein
MSLTVALIGATVVTLAHAATHYTFGDADTFEQAGVRPAGIAVFVSAFIAFFVFL